MEENRLLKDNLPSLFIGYVLLAVIAMVLSGIQGMIDGIFLGNYAGSNVTARQLFRSQENGERQYFVSLSFSCGRYGRAPIWKVFQIFRLKGERHHLSLQQTFG